MWRTKPPDSQAGGGASSPQNVDRAFRACAGVRLLRQQQVTSVLWSEIAGSYDNNVFSFVKKPQTVFQSDCSFCIPTSNERGFLLLPVLVSVCWCQCSRFCLSNRCVVKSRCCQRQFLRNLSEVLFLVLSPLSLNPVSPPWSIFLLLNTVLGPSGYVKYPPTLL